MRTLSRRCAVGREKKYSPPPLEAGIEWGTLTAATPVSVTFAASAGTAVAGRDFTPLSTTANFAASETMKTVDAAGFQGSRTVNIALTNPTVGALGAPATAVVTITENDAQPGGAVAGSYAKLLKSVPAATLIIQAQSR